MMETTSADAADPLSEQPEDRVRAKNVNWWIGDNEAIKTRPHLGDGFSYLLGFRHQ